MIFGFGTLVPLGRQNLKLRLIGCRIPIDRTYNSAYQAKPSPTCRTKRLSIPKRRNSLSHGAVLQERLAGAQSICVQDSLLRVYLVPKQRPSGKVLVLRRKAKPKLARARNVGGRARIGTPPGSTFGTKLTC